MKYIVILSLLGIFLALIYFRLRPYIKMARRMLGVVRDVRGMGQSGPGQNLRSEATGNSRLVRCDSCNTWIPATRAVKLRSSSSAYCSHACLENAATADSKRKTAG